MAVELFRIDDRLIHGQVTVGWTQPLGVRFISLVDDDIAASDWEQELYKMAVPAGVDLYFDTVESAVRRLPEYLADVRKGIVLTGSVQTMRRIVDGSRRVPTVNIGGVHHRAGRQERLRYVFLTPDEERDLRAIADAGVEVTAQDLPGATPVPLSQLVSAESAA